jgi:two-component system, NtrC family, response regulator HydG
MFNNLTNGLNMFEHELDRYWKTVVNSIKDGLMIVDRRGIIVSVNKALESMVHFSRDELIGRSCEVLNCDACDKVRQDNGGHWCRLFKTGSLTTGKCTVIRKDGKMIHVLKNASLLHDDDGETIGAVETITDLTDVMEKDNQIAQFRRELQGEDAFHGIIGNSAAMQQVFDLITDASQSDAPVIITGESGTGKELVCKAIHAISLRKRKPLIKVNCAALTDSLLESELFGHVRGAFTGAWKDREGRFECAHQGDLFLDEIGDLPLATQVKLLRVLEEKVIERVGANIPVPVDVRIISATNRNLKQLVAKGVFRKDLFFRINVIPIHLPPLRERPEDIPLLARSFFRRIKLKSGKMIDGIGNDAIEVLMNYPWPGNIRELKSAFEYAFVNCHEPLIRAQHLPPNVLYGEGQPKSAHAPKLDRDTLKRSRLVEALEKCNGRLTQAAQVLGVSRVTVWNQMKRYGVHLERKPNLRRSEPTGNDELM